jgi:thermitase
MATAALTCLGAAPAVAAGLPEPEDLSTGAFVPGEAIVRFDPSADAADRLAARQAADVAFDEALTGVRAQVVDFDGGVAAAVRRLERQPGVVHAQPNYRYRALAVAAPNDTFFGDLWGLEDPATPNPGVDVLEAWAKTRGAGQVIAIVDTGVDLSHPDLQANLWQRPGGIHGRDFVDGDDDPDDYNFHGTHVAGTAAALAGNGLGVAGVAPQAKIMAVRVLDGDGSGTSSDIGSGIAYAAQNGADVINLSLGGPAGAGDDFMASAVALAAKRDAVVVAAAGNDNSNNDVAPTTPCTLPGANLICVAAVNQAGSRASFSNYGMSTVDVAAPGTSILSAKTDYGAVFSDGFEGGLGAWEAFDWATTSTWSASGTQSVTDSPGDDYVSDADSELSTSVPLDMTSRRGCRVHLALRYDIQPPDGGSLTDVLFVGAVSDDEEAFDVLPFAGQTPSFAGGSYVLEDVSISDLDGRSDVYPFLGLFSDDSIEADGAYADDLSVLCRDDSYLDSKAATGNYVAFQGTSMAAPHVAGVAALVGAADPGAPASQIVQAIQGGGAPLAAPAFTKSGRTADADGAIAAPNPAPVKVAGPLPPPKPNLGGARKRTRVSKRGRFSYLFKATPGMSGSVLFRTHRKVEVSRRAKLTLARRPFTVIRTDGRVAVAVKLSRRQLRILRRNRKLVLDVTATVRNFAGLSAQAQKRLTLLPPKR